MKTIEQILGKILVDSEAYIEKFKKDLDEDPHYAFRWSLEAFRHASRIVIVKRSLNVIKNAITPKPDVELVQYLERELLKFSDGISNCSTSQTANLNKSCDLEALAYVLTRVKDF